ncbi:MAG: isocitrate lyase [Legionellaceae bacterium]|nr:isocitrate lyase [Legionellaceae bacterium]
MKAKNLLRQSRVLTGPLFPHLPVHSAFRGLHIDPAQGNLLAEELKQQRQALAQQNTRKQGATPPLSSNFFNKTRSSSLFSEQGIQSRAYTVSQKVSPRKPTYLERIQETQHAMDIMQDSGRNFSGITAEEFVRQEMLGEFDGIPFSGINVSKWAANKMRGDMEVYRQDRTKYTMSLGAASGLFAQQCIISAKKERGSLARVYVYLSGWQVAAMKAPESPQPDVSAHSKNAVVNTIEEIYRYLHQADQVEKVKIYQEIDEARKKGAHEASLTKLYKKLDHLETHIVPMIADVDAGFGNTAAAQMLMKRCVEAGTAALQIENQVSDEKKCGHLNGKVTIPPADTESFLRAARHAAIEAGNPDAIIVARTDSLAAGLTKVLPPEGHSGSYDYNKHLDMTEVTSESIATLPQGSALITHDGRLMHVARELNGLYKFKNGTGKQRVIEDCRRFLDYGADMLWIETDKPDKHEMLSIMEEIRKTHPQAMLVYNNSPSFPWIAQTRAMLYKQWAESGQDMSAYPDPNSPDFTARLAGKEFNNTELDLAACRYVREFQREMALEAGVFHNLITLPDFHNTANGAQKIAQGYFRTKENADKMGSEYGMGHYVRVVQNEEIRSKRSCFNHQTTSGTGINSFQQQAAGGEHALTPDGKHNTANLFGALVTESPQPIPTSGPGMKL